MATSSTSFKPGAEWRGNNMGRVRDTRTVKLARQFIADKSYENAQICQGLIEKLALIVQRSETVQDTVTAIRAMAPLLAMQLDRGLGKATQTVDIEVGQDAEEIRALPRRAQIDLLAAAEHKARRARQHLELEDKQAKGKRVDR